MIISKQNASNLKKYEFIGVNIMEEYYRKELEYWEYLAHLNAFKPMGKNYWDNFLAREVYYNAKFKKYNRRW